MIMLLNASHRQGVGMASKTITAGFDSSGTCNKTESESRVIPLWLSLEGLSRRIKSRHITCVSGNMDVRLGIINQTKRPPRVDTDMMSNIPQDENIGESFSLFFLYG
jgi:hypothetical protein